MQHNIADKKCKSSVIGISNKNQEMVTRKCEMNFEIFR